MTEQRLAIIEALYNEWSLGDEADGFVSVVQELLAEVKRLRGKLCPECGERPEMRVGYDNAKVLPDGRWKYHCHHCGADCETTEVMPTCEFRTKSAKPSKKRPGKAE